jgi:hypothetical protein
MLHQFFDLPKLTPTLVALVPFKHTLYLSPLAVSVVVVVVLVVPRIPALSTKVAVYLPGRLRVVMKQS